MTWTPRPSPWRWREFLTEEERDTLAKAEEAKSVWQRLDAERVSITNRAIQRAKYAAQKGSSNA